MPSTMQVLPYSPDLLDSIIKDIEGQAAKNVSRKIIQCFDAEGFAIKIQRIIPGKSHAYYRVLCFVKKSKETVSINTKKNHGVEGLDVKIRIDNQNTFDKLDKFTDNIRNQILNAIDCHYCGTKCEGKRYTFAYNGNEYIKCQYLGCNFRFPRIEECDVASIMDIVNGELTHWSGDSGEPNAKAKAKAQPNITCAAGNDKACMGRRRLAAARPMPFESDYLHQPTGPATRIVNHADVVRDFTLPADWLHLFYQR